MIKMGRLVMLANNKMVIELKKKFIQMEKKLS